MKRYGEKGYCAKYDAYVTEDGEWKESACSDKNCVFCAWRPTHPSMVLANEFE